jgi:hypothetical protein
MTSWEATFVMRKAEDGPADPEGTEGYTASCAQGQKHRKKDLNEELSHFLPYNGNMEGDHFEQRTVRKKGNELS